jgi:DNA-binding YbaB/EbfC family protein
MKQAKQMQQQMLAIKEELKGMEFEASSGGGVVKVKVSGEQELTEVKINKEMVDTNDIEMLEDMLLVAVNDAINKSKEEAKNKLGALTGGLNIPGLF